MDSIPEKTCNRCHETYPATPEYFKKATREPLGITQPCRACNTAINRDYYGRPDIQEKEKARKRTPEYKAKVQKYRHSPAYLEKARERDSKRRITPEYKIQAKEYNSRPDVIERNRQRNTTPEKRAYSREYQRQRRLDPECIQKQKDYLRLPEVKERYRLHTQVRRAKAKALPSTFTHVDKERALQYFNGLCPVCGRQFRDLLNTHTIAWDHWWIPQSKNGGFTPDNMLPLCHGLNGCNNSKHNHDPVEWLTAKYGKRKANKILGKIKAYFEWLLNM